MSPRPHRRSGWPAARSPCSTSPPPGPISADYAHETQTVLGVIGARFVLLGEPFAEFVEMFDGTPIRGLVIADLIASGPGSAPPAVSLPLVPEEGPALLQLTSGSTVDTQGRADHPPEPVGEHHRCARRPTSGRPGRDGVLAAAVPRHGHGRFPDPADVPRHRAGQGHPGRLPVRPVAVGRVDQPVPRDHHRRTELRLRPDRPGAGPRGRRISTCPACGSRSTVPSRSTSPRCGRSSRPARRSACRRPRWSAPTAWPRPRSAVSFHPWGTPVKMDTVDAEQLENQRASPSRSTGRSPDRRAPFRCWVRRCRASRWPCGTATACSGRPRGRRAAPARARR